MIFILLSFPYKQPLFLMKHYFTKHKHDKKLKMYGILATKIFILKISIQYSSKPV